MPIFEEFYFEFLKRPSPLFNYLSQLLVKLLGFCARNVWKFFEKAAPWLVRPSFLIREFSFDMHTGNHTVWGIIILIFQFKFFQKNRLSV